MLSLIASVLLAAQPPVPPDGIPVVPTPEPLPVTSYSPTLTPSPEIAPWQPEAFAKEFPAKAGLYEIVFSHPKTGQPVVAKFELPDAPIKKVVATKHRIHFDYGRKDVSVWFQHDGTVRVKYH